MKKTTPLYALLLILSISTHLKAQSTIQWSKDLKLTWPDFKAIPNEEIIAYALTSYKIEILPSNVAVDSNNNIPNYETLTVVANFYTTHSWVFEKSDYLLSHEQLHFDIAGLYAYKMRTEFEKLKKQKVANFDSYSEVYKKLWAECREVQKAYDKETNHGQRVEENNQWIANITQQISHIE